jgi:O-antigen ligase
MEAVLPIALYESFREKRNALLYCSMAAAMYASVVATGSRMGVLLTTAEIAGVIALLWYRRRGTEEAFAAPLWRGALLGAVFVLVVGYGTVLTRFQTEDVTVIRLPYAIATIEMIANRPWAGTGLGTWPIVYPQYAALDTGTRANRAHNDWLQWTSEGGVFLGAAMFLLFLWCLRPAIQSVWGLGLIAVFLHAAVDYPFSRPALGGWYILLLATLSSWSEKQAEKRKV